MFILNALLYLFVGLAAFIVVLGGFVILSAPYDEIYMSITRSKLLAVILTVLFWVMLGFFGYLLVNTVG